MGGSGRLRRTERWRHPLGDRKSTRLNSSHLGISYAVFCLKKKRSGQECRKASQHEHARGQSRRSPPVFQIDSCHLRFGRKLVAARITSNEEECVNPAHASV